MARKTRVVSWLVDDLTGEDLPEGEGQTVIYGLDGRTYEIDLSDHNADQIRQLLAPLIAASRQIDGPKQKGKKPISEAQRRQLDEARARQVQNAQERREIAARAQEPDQGLTAYQRTLEHRNRLRTIRLWAQEQGLQQSLNGRLRPEVRDAWNAAHPEDPAPDEGEWQRITQGATLTADPE